MEGTESNLIAYYNFDQGIAEGDNSSITELKNLVDSSGNGELNKFTLISNVSNFINLDCSGCPNHSGLSEAFSENKLKATYTAPDNALTAQAERPIKNVTISIYGMGGKYYYQKNHI